MHAVRGAPPSGEVSGEVLEGAVGTEHTHFVHTCERWRDRLVATLMSLHSWAGMSVATVPTSMWVGSVLDLRVRHCTAVIHDCLFFDINREGIIEIIWSSENGFTVDALEPSGDEGRGKLR